MYGKLFLLFVIARVHSLDYTELSDEDAASPSLSGELSDFFETEEFHPNLTCSADLIRFILNTKREEWAKQMFDSMERTPYGALYGRNVFMGNFDECISANAKDFKGKHCMVDIIFDSDEKNFMSLGFCVPSTCTAAQVKYSVEDYLSKGRNVTIRTNDKNCWTNDPVVLSTQDWIVIGFFSFIVLIAICSTIFDVLHQNNAIKSNKYELFSSFSLYKNGKDLLKIHNGPDNIGCINGIRSLTMIWIILGHEYMFVSVMPLTNTVAISQDFVQNKYEIPILNGFLSVDTFLLLSGLLVTTVFFRLINKTGSYDCLAVAIHRFIRVTPAFAAVVLVQSTIIVKFGKGPMWNRVIGGSVEMCREIWWTGIVYLENIITPSARCVQPSWYLSIDMQMFWGAPLLLYPLLLCQKNGFWVWLTGITAALTTNFLVSYLYELGPHRMITDSKIQLQIDYVQTHMRLTPYVVGIGLGYLLCGVKTKRVVVNLTKKWIVVGWLLSAVLCLGSMYGVIYFIDNDFTGQFIASSSYLTFHRLGWSLGVAWVIFACSLGYGGFVDRMLSWNGFQIFAKISYSMFLVHTPLQLCKNGLMKTDFYANDFFLIYHFSGTLVISIFLSIFLYLFIETPFINLDKHLLGNLRIFPCPRKVKSLLDNSAEKQPAAPELISIVSKNW